MRIAVDARELAGRRTGVGRYLSELLAAWTLDREAARHEWRLYAHAPGSTPIAMPHEFTEVPGTGGTAWEQWALARQLAADRPDVLFAPAYSAPLTAACPVAVTIHDVSFAARPEWFSAREGLRRRVLTRWSARRARVVVTDTAFSRDEIVRYLGTPPARIRVIPLGMRRLPYETSAPVTREPIVLFVGTIFARRHVDRLIAAFVEQVAARVPTSRLEIVGENRTSPRQDLVDVLRAVPGEVASRVAVRSYVDELTLAALYRRAAVFAFLSEYEGFGLTPLEALAAGVPIVVLDTPVAREVYGPAARYVSDLSPEGLAGALVELLTSDVARSEQLSRAEEVLGRYDWRRTAAATLRALEEAAGIDT